MVVDRSRSINDVLPFLKAEIPRADISAMEVKNHGRAHRGRIRVVKRSGEAVDLARLDVDTEKESYADLVAFVKSIYPEIPKTVD
jgi:hypothetical protein